MGIGAVIWSVLAAASLTWAAVLVVGRSSVLGVQALTRWLLSAWFPRVLLLSGWAVAGWHVFCQRP